MHVPGITLIVSPALAASIAVCNVGKSVGTVILAALAVGRGDNDSTMRKIIAEMSVDQEIFSMLTSRGNK